MFKADLHLHSNNSDGSDSLEELAAKINSAGLNAAALTDHDTVLGSDKMSELLDNSVKYIKGVELTCKSDDLSVHILGFNIDTKNSELLNLIEKGKILRRQKLETRIKYLKETWNINLTQEETDWLYSRTSPVKTHFANILVKRGLADNNVEAMKKYLDGCKTGNTKFTIDEAVNAILSAGGIPVWAHPLGGEGERHFSRDEFIPKLERMINYGIKGLECYYSRYNSVESEFLTDCAQKYNLLISGGSDYHGRNKDIPIGRLNSDDEPVNGNLLTLLEVL